MSKDKKSRLPPLSYVERSYAKPCFLERLESYLRTELQRLDVNSPDIQENRFQVYREVFDYLIEEFTTYKPLLCDIRHEYDITLARLRDRIRNLEPLQAKLVLVSEECERKILDLRVKESNEIKALKQECQRLRHVIQDMREQQSDLETQVSFLKEDLARQYKLYRDERDARKLLIIEINSTRSALDQHDNEHKEDLVVVKMALNVCREDLTKAQAELNRLQTHYSDVVPLRDWENINCLHKETLLKLETLKTDFDQMKSEYDTLLKVHLESAPAVLHSNQSVLQHGSDHIVTTTRSNWEQRSDGDSEQVLDQNSSEFFTGLGTSNDVPVYLRYMGKFKNLKLKKADVVRVIKDIWRDKTAENEKNDDCSDLKLFLHNYLVEHFKEKAGDWAYSLMESIKNNLKDDLICLFNDILTGKVDESLYHEQNHLLSHLLKVLIKSDTTECGSLTVLEFSEALRKTFPLKTDQDIQELLAVAQTELKSDGGRIAYQTLYTEDTDGKHKEFLNLVKKQATAERLQYISKLREQLEGKGEVDAKDLRTAFQTIDPSLDSATLDWNLSIAFQARGSELEAQALNTEVVLQRLSVANVKRGGPK